MPGRMVRKNPTDQTRNTTGSWPRRNLLKLSGVGVGIAGIGGLGTLGAARNDDENADDNNDNGGNDDDGNGDDDTDSLIDDLTDPVFGYPLSEGEAEDISIDTVVELEIEEGEGAHEGFPSEPDPDTPGAFIEIDAEFFFNPVGLHIEPDELVHFENVSHLHTVTAFHEKFSDPHFEMPNRVPNGVPGFTSPPIVGGESWVYQFEEKGVYDIFCFPHLGLGMVARIVVFDSDEDDIDDDTFSAPTEGPLEPNAETVLTADELDPENIVDEGTVDWADLTLETDDD